MTSAFASSLEALCPSFSEISVEGQEALLRLLRNKATDKQTQRSVRNDRVISY